MPCLYCSVSRLFRIVALNAFLFITFLALLSTALFAEKWTDISGKHSIDARYISLEDEVVLLRRTNGKQVRIALAKLDGNSQKQAMQIFSEKMQKPRRAIVVGITTAPALENAAKKSRSATHALKLYESFLALPDIESKERTKAKKRLKQWRERSQEGRLRWGMRWLKIDEIRKGLIKEEQLLKEAHRLIEIGNDKMARERFLLASESNPEGLRGNFYLGILDALLGQDAKSAEKQFSICVNRLKQAPDRLVGVRRSNLIAALNNRAICRVRRGDHKKAMKDWKEAIQLSPMTPELVQNLGYYARLASVVPGWRVSRSASRSVADQYAKITVANRTSEFQEHVGWLIVPYVDAPQLPDFEDIQLVDAGEFRNGQFLDLESGAESDFRVVGWATGVAVDKDHLLMARSSVNRSQGLWIRRDGKLWKEIPGKVVAVSGSFDLALVHFDGLDADVVPFATGEPTRATEIRALGFPEPGILEDSPQVAKGTIIDLGSIYVPLGRQYLSKSVTRTNLVATESHSAGESETMLQTTSVPIGREYVTSLIHDAFLNRGSLGAPLFNLRGKIIGFDLDGSEQEELSGNSNHAISIAEVRAFLDSTSLQFPDINENPTGSVGDIDEFVRATADSAVFQVAVVGRTPRLSWSDRIGSVRGIQAKEGWNAYEDFWCMRCNGRGEVACPERGCVGGRVSHRETYIHSRLTRGEPVYRQKIVKERCRRCNASGMLTCPHCRGRKREPSL